jgi:glyoxylase-like metal-dependent hydrolase (beta-lactamase superfamily II)
MELVEGAVDVDVPPDVLGSAFFRPHLWPAWNTCIAWVRNHELRLGDRLVFLFEPVRPWLPYRLPCTSRISQLEPNRRVTWEVTALPGFYARHTYSITPLSGGRSRFSSSEQAAGPSFRAARALWLAHFNFVKERSMQGVRLLEAAYRLHGRLDEADVPRRRGAARSLRDLLGVTEILRFRPVALDDDIWALRGGGGNSLIVKGDDEALLIDTKMAFFARLLCWWARCKLGVPVTTVVNTHFHFDHTFGNARFDGVTVRSHKNTPELMRGRDPEFWQSHPESVPSDLIETDHHLKFGEASIAIYTLPPAHTAGDLWAHVRKNGHDYVFTGDIGSFGHYPFLDVGEGGTDLAGWARACRQIANTLPGATFVPGHGPVGNAGDLRRLACYIEFLERSVKESAAEGLDVGATIRNVDLSSWRLRVLPVFHYGERLISARANVRRAFRLCVGTSGALAGRAERSDASWPWPVAGTAQRAGRSE